MSNPSISVVIPVFNAGDRLPRALTSIDEQHYPGPLQIIVVDDGSTDDTPERLAELGNRILSIRQDNLGPAAARNTGIAAATEELLAFLDADDQWTVDKLERQVGALRDDPSLDIVLGRIRCVAASAPTAPRGREPLLDLSMSNVHLGSGLFRRSAFERVGLFDPTLRFSEDHDWFLRAREANLSIRVLDHVALVYLLHDRNMTRGREPHELLLTTVLKRSLDRRRQAGTAMDLPPWRTYDDRHRKPAP